MLEEEFDVLFTFDKNLQHQQNIEKYPIAVLVLNTEDDAYITLKDLVPQIIKILGEELPKGPIEVKARA